MKKVSAIITAFILVLSFSSCGSINHGEVDNPSNSLEHSENPLVIPNDSLEQSEMPTIIPNDVPEGSKEDLAVRETVKEYLDNFTSCDFDKIKAQLHEEDKWLFNFESEDQMKFYNTIFPLITYEFEFVSEHEGVYGVMTRIVSPSMADVYGTIITEYLDTSISEDTQALSELVQNNTERMLTLLKDPSLPKRDERLYIYVEYINGKYIPRCDFYLANEITGGAPEASGEITGTLNDTITSLSE